MHLLPALRRLAVLATLAGMATAAAPTTHVLAGGGPVTYDYPSGACPAAGDHGLQDCIDGAAAGDIIHLVAEVLDDEVAEITKDLTLTGSGPTPFPRIRGVVVRDGGPGSSVDATVKDVRLIFGALVSLEDGQGHRILFDRVTIGQGDIFRSFLDVATAVSADVTVRRSRIHGENLDQEEVVTLRANDPDGDVGFHLIGNTIEAVGESNSGAGVEIDGEGDGVVRATLDNNVIHHVASCNCGASSGIAVLPEGPIRMSVDVVGNTLHGFDANGIQQRNDVTGIGHISLRVFGNVFSRLEVAINLDKGAAGSLTYLGGYNDVFASGGVFLDGKPAGPGNRNVDPRFVKPSTNDFHLRADSPVIDKGLICPPTGVENLDAAGRGRLAGPSVDLGAFERGAAAPTGVARTGGSGADSLVGTNGADILCGLGGPDGLTGLGGRDVLDGGPGNDVLFGNAGPDRLLGRDGADTLCARDGVQGNDRSDGGPGPDKGRSDPGDVRVSVESGADCSPD